MSAFPSVTAWHTWLDMPVENSKSQPGLSSLNCRHSRVTVGGHQEGDGLHPDGAHPLLQHLEVAQAAVRQGDDLPGLGEQGLPEPAQGDAPGRSFERG